MSNPIDPSDATVPPPAADVRASLAEWANATARLSRYHASAPVLSADSPRATILAWLLWNDRNGIYTDANNEAEGYDPLTLAQAWAYVWNFREEDN